MILLLGGTTEGRKAVETLEEAGQPYYYSTKSGEQQLTLRHGRRNDGALDREALSLFCRKQAIRLIVDAAHPFARQLHQNVADVSARLRLPVVRYERIYPPRDSSITWIDSYTDIPDGIRTLLATTGVQSIAQLKPLEARGIRVFYRILPRPSSIALAHQLGATDEQLCYYEDGSAISVKADALLLKESGLSGGFAEKVVAARAHGMSIIALKRPPMPDTFITVNGPYGLRRAVEQLLPEFFPLHSGLTTGTCATAAAIAATQRLLTGQQPSVVPVTLPNGETIHVPVGYGDGYAYVVKQAGDDPDVTDGLEIRASVERSQQFEVRGGQGVGIFTLPGFDYPPGSPAINKGPRQMMQTNIHDAVAITISVPDGEAVARRTFNPRLGIRDGISIIGVSGIVKPFSEEAFVQSIRKCMEVAKASGAERIVVNSGAKSERYVRAHYPTLPPQAFVEYGNYIGQTLQMAHELGIARITLGLMLGKAVKLAAGQLDTHSRRATMDRAFVGQMLAEAGCDPSLSNDVTLARELWERLSSQESARFAHVVISHCQQHCQPLLPNGELTILLIDEQGRLHTATLLS